MLQPPREEAFVLISNALGKGVALSCLPLLPSRMARIHQKPRNYGKGKYGPTPQIGNWTNDLKGNQLYAPIKNGKNHLLMD
jgi:hypothetical protein